MAQMLPCLLVVAIHLPAEFSVARCFQLPTPEQTLLLRETVVADPSKPVTSAHGIDPEECFA